MSRTVAFAALLLAAASGAAEAHGMLQGVGDVYAGLLHPLVVSAEALALVAVGLLLGTSGLSASRIGLPALAGGLAAGIFIGRYVPLPLATPLLLSVALGSAVLVTAVRRLPPPAAAGLAALGGAAVGIDAQPDAEALQPLILAGGATIVGGTALATIAAGLALGREQHWQRVVVRVAGSWITASAVLYFAWLVAADPT